MSDALPEALLQISDMILGLVRAAELKEQREGGNLWDDESQKALQIARALGLHGQARPLATREAVAQLILSGLDLTTEQVDFGSLRMLVYPSIQPDGSILYQATLARNGVTQFHVAHCASRAEAKTKLREKAAQFTTSLGELLHDVVPGT